MSDTYLGLRLPQGKTPWAITTHCGDPADSFRVYLTMEQYRSQLARPDSTWACPEHGLPANWDDDWHDNVLELAEAAMFADPDCADCDGAGWVCGGEAPCTLAGNLEGREPDHEVPCPSARPCGCGEEGS